MRALTPTQILFLHAQLADRLGQTRGVADPAALAAALAAVEAAAGAVGLFELAATLAGSLAARHPFHGANLALAAAAAALLLRQYDLDLHLDPAEMPALGALLAADDRPALESWLRSHTAPRPLD